MAIVKIEGRKVWVDDQPIALLSGEIHYWRIDPHNWRPALQRAREMGLNVLATYACWDFHEVQQGQFDFHGTTDPRRNLVGFLELLTEEGFWIIFRPGPYIYSEWSNNGVPDHAAQYHRLDPAYLQLAEAYMAAVTEVVKPYIASNGGNIILWQADNEIDPWPHLYSEQLGLGRKIGPFHDYLRKRYGGVEALNHAWRSDYKSFDEARAVSEMFTDDTVLLSRYLDYRAFLHDYVNQVATWAVGGYRSLGVNVPVMLNAYSGVGTQCWADLEAIGDLVGPDIYPSREFLNRGGAGEHRHVLEAVRYADSFSRLPYIPEYEAGIWHDWLDEVGSLPPNHYRLICISALQAGAAGWNWYMLVNRDNWYQSPINEWGRIKPGLFNAFQQITTLFNELDPTTLNRLTHTAVTFDPLQRATDRPGQHLLSSFYAADIDYDFYDLSGGETDKKLLFYAGGAWLSTDGQQKLVDYVENGGHLVCLGSYPRQDEHLHPLNLLDISAPDGILTGQGKMNLKLLGDQSVESHWIYNYDAVPGEAIAVERLSIRNKPSAELLLQFDLQNGARYTVGYTQTRGNGRLTVIGLQPSPESLLVLHQHFAVPIVCRSHTGAVTTGLFQRDDDLYLMATNVGVEDKGARIEIDPAMLPSGSWKIQNLECDLVSTIDITDRPFVDIQLPRKDGLILRLSRA
jgi:hypothetical protein